MFNVIKDNIMAYLRVGTKATFDYLFHVSFTCLKLPNLTV